MNCKRSFRNFFSFLTVCKRLLLSVVLSYWHFVQTGFYNLSIKQMLASKWLKFSYIFPITPFHNILMPITLHVSYVRINNSTNLTSKASRNSINKNPLTANNYNDWLLNHKDKQKVILVVIKLINSWTSKFLKHLKYYYLLIEIIYEW